MNNPLMRRVLVGLIGANIQKSLSPTLHEDAFAAAGLRGFYHLMDLNLLPGRRLEHLLDAARTAGFAGVNVTYPCKEAVLPLLDEISSQAREIGAVNTVTIDASRRTVGHNTDRSGFRLSFEETLGRKAVAGKTALLIGAGGAGRAVAFALFDLGVARLLIHDTDMQRRTALVADLVLHFGTERCGAAESIESAMREAAGVVNATPVGMLGGPPGIPLPVETITAEHFVADVIYTPLETALIKAAKKRGARTLTGGGMCVHQAAEAFRLFTGRTPDVTRMQKLFAQAVTARDQALAEAG